MVEDLPFIALNLLIELGDYTSGIRLLWNESVIHCSTIEKNTRAIYCVILANPLPYFFICTLC